MPGLLPTFDRGPLSFAAHVNILGGQLVVPAPAGRIQPAGADAVDCLGVAMGDAAAFTYAPADSTDPWGNSIANMNPFPPNETAVAHQGIFVLKNSAAGVIAFGALIACAANGEIKAFVNAAAGAASNVTSIIGRCVEPGGIAAGARGKIRLGGVG